MRLATIEQGGEQPTEMPIHRFEGGKQPLPTFAVKAADRPAQPVDRLRQLLAFGTALGLRRLQFLQFLRRHQIDWPHALALRRQPVKLCLLRLAYPHVSARKAQFFRQ